MRSHFLLRGHLVRPELITDTNQAIVWQAKLEAFDRSVLTTSIGDFNIGFPGQYWDAEKQSWYNYFGDYDATTGRYLQSDPIGLEAGLNTYGYVMANPVNWVDPYGLDMLDPLWGAIYWGTGGWSPSQSTVDFSAGFGDTISFGFTNKIRDWNGTNGVVDKCSSSYTNAESAGYVFGAVGGSAIAARALGWSLSADKYRNAGGFGINLYKNGKRKFGVDWHKFNHNGKTMNRPHYHRGATNSQMKKHRPWQGGW